MLGLELEAKSLAKVKSATSPNKIQPWDQRTGSIGGAFLRVWAISWSARMATASTSMLTTTTMTMATTMSVSRRALLRNFCLLFLFTLGEDF